MVLHCRERLPGNRETILKLNFTSGGDNYRRVYEKFIKDEPFLIVIAALFSWFCIIENSNRKGVLPEEVRLLRMSL